MTKNTIILGTGELARQLATELAARPRRRYRLVGVVGGSYNGWRGNCPYLGAPSELPDLVAEHRVGRIIIALDDTNETLPLDTLIKARARRAITVESATEVLERLTGRLLIESLPHGFTLFSDEFRRRRLGSSLCRLLSLIVATPALLIALPLMAVIALAIRLDSPGPALFVQNRVGRHGQHFRFFKFRSMLDGTDKHSEWESDNLEEVTRVGRILRKFRLDELPQFINVIAGDMNIVGPRPHPSTNRELFTLVARNASGGGRQIPCYSIRQTIRPGITGWAQVRYKYANGLDEELEKLQYDLYYVKHYSPLLDLRILLETVKIVLGGNPDRAPMRAETTRLNWTATDQTGESAQGTGMFDLSVQANRRSARSHERENADTCYSRNQHSDRKAG